MLLLLSLCIFPVLPVSFSRSILTSGRTVPSGGELPCLGAAPSFVCTQLPHFLTSSILPSPPRTASPGMEVGLPWSVCRTSCFLPWQREPENGVPEDFRAEERDSFGVCLPAAH